MKASVICVSHTDGAGGDAVGRRVAELLGFRFADESIVVAAANDRGLYPESVAQAERQGAGRSLEVDFGRFERTEALREVIRAAIGRAADGGDVVIASHAASFALAGRPEVLRVLVTASLDTRAARIASAEQVDVRRALKELAGSDKGRTVYLRRFYGVKAEKPTHYDLVVSTDRLTTDEAAGIVVAAAGA